MGRKRAISALREQGQYVVCRYHLTNLTTGWSGTSGWLSPKWIPYSTTSGRATYIYAPSSLPGALFNKAASARWTVQAQFGYWNGSSYNWSGWYKAGGYSRPGTTCSLWSDCTT